MKVAAVLFVKNEVEDIAWWLSWHLSIGIDTIIVYDDYSSDGTWEVVNAAAKIYDIRPKRAVQELRFNVRQANTYMSALAEFQNEFDWLVYLDADEYIDILNGDDVHTFLNQYEDDIDGIALHWQCYGSNRHVERPPSPNVFENYWMHSYPDFEMNQYVKSFFRPKRAEIKYINPHRFAVSGKYVTPNKAIIEWQEVHKERPKAQPDWSVAVVRHYLIRSAEHFVEKSKRRSDIRAAKVGIGLFNAYDKNDLYGPMDNRRVAAMYPYIYDIQHQISLDIIEQIEKNSKMSQNCEFMKSDDIDKVFILNVETHFSTELAVEKEFGSLVHIHPDTDHKDVSLVTLFSIPNKLDYIFLIVLDGFTPMHSVGEIRVSKILAYKKIDIHNQTFALQSPLTKKIVTFVKIEGDNLLGYADCKSDWTYEWETLAVKEIKEVREGILIDIAKAIAGCGFTDKDNNSLDKDLYADAFVAGLVTLDSRQAQKLYVENNLTVYPWLQQDNLLSL